MNQPLPDRIELPLPVTPPFDFDLTVGVHARFPQEAVHRYAPGHYWRAFWLNGRPVVAALNGRPTPDEPSLTLTLSGPHLAAAEIDHLAERISFSFALQEDPAPFVRHARSDPILAGLIRRYPGLRPARSPGLHEQLIGSIIAQQITLSFAAIVRQRLVQRYGHPVPYEDFMLWTFPSPDALVDAAVEDLMALQFSRRKAEYVIGVSRNFAAREIEEAALARLPDEAVIDALTRRRGLGRWSAEWALIRGLGRTDVAPADDIGVQQAVALFYPLAEGRVRKASAAQVAQIAESWRPFRSMATTYLLTALRLQRTKTPAD